MARGPNTVATWGYGSRHSVEVRLRLPPFDVTDRPDGPEHRPTGSRGRRTRPNGRRHSRRRQGKTECLDGYENSTQDGFKLGTARPTGVLGPKTWDRRVDARRWLRQELAKIDQGDWVDPSAGTVTFGNWTSTGTSMSHSTRRPLTASRRWWSARSRTERARNAHRATDPPSPKTPKAPASIGFQPVEVTGFEPVTPTLRT